MGGEESMENSDSSILVKNEEGEYTKKKTSNYDGISYNADKATWRTKRWSKTEKRYFRNGVYKDEKTAALASDTLARKLMAFGEQNHKLNFLDDNTEVYPEEKDSEYAGVYYNENSRRWRAKRWSKIDKKSLSNGSYDDEITAAHASDSLARKLIANGEKGHKLNFPDDHTEYSKMKQSKWIGVSYNERGKQWIAQRWSKAEKRIFNDGYHKDEEKAVHASDALARRLMENGEQGHKLNFPDDNEKVNVQEKGTNKRKRPSGFECCRTGENNLEK